MRRRILVLIVSLFLLIGVGFVSAAPLASGVGVNPSVTNVNPSLTATVTESNASNIIIDAEYFIDSVGTDGTGFPLTASDGLFNETSEAIYASINIIGLSEGDHIVHIHALNNNSEWGNFFSKNFTVDTVDPSLTSALIIGAGSGNRISPTNGDGLYDDVTFWMNSNEFVDWGQTKIYNSTADQVKHFNGPLVDVTFNLENWYGTLSSGGNAPDGTYTVYTDLVDKAGNSATILVGSVIVDNTAPTGTVSVGTPIIYIGDLIQEVTIDYDEAMDTSYTPMINFTGNTGEIRSQGDGAWSVGNTRWTETFLVEDADEETTDVTVASSLARDLAGNLEVSVDPTFDIDTKAPVITDLSASTTDLETNNDNDVTISAKVVEGYGAISNVVLEGNWTGSWVNYTGLTVTGDVYSYVVSNTLLENQEYVGWRFYATDNLGNLRASAPYEFLVENRAPQFVPSIADLAWIEDGGFETIDLDTYFYDEDLDALTYTAAVVSNPGPTSNPFGGGITVSIVGNIATISSSTGWNGDGTIVFTATDAFGATNDSNVVNVVVEADQNEAPTLTSSISPVEFNEDETITLQIDCDANDPGQVCLNYRYDENYVDYDENLNVDINPSGQVVLDTELNWNGLTYVRFLADDDGTPLETGSVVVQVNVTPVNDNPLMNVPDVDMIQNDPEPAPIDLRDYTTDVDNNVLTEMSYTLVSQSNASLISCSLGGTVLTCSAPTFDWYGYSDLVVEVEDGNGGDDAQNIRINVKKNHAPVIVSATPNYDPIIRTGNNQDFSVVAEDVDDPILNYEWFVNGISQATTESFSYAPGSDGDYNITVEVTDDAPNTVSHKWTLTASSYPIADTFTGSETTDFTTIPDLSNAANVVLQNDYGKIEFLAPLDLTNVFDLDNNVKIQRDIFALNTAQYPQLNVPARITLTGLSYNSIPELYYSNGFTTNAGSIDELCDFCNVTNSTDFPTNDGIFVFEVDHFTSFAVKNSGMIYDLSTFNDLDVCEDGVIGDLKISIDNPDKNDDFVYGDEIEINVEVDNDANEDKKIVVEASLFDVEDDDEIASVKSDSITIDEGESEDFDLFIPVPKDFEENDHIIYVKAYEKGDEDIHCNQDLVQINLEREDHDLIIENLEADSTARAGDDITVDLGIKNVGAEEEEDVYIKIEQDDLEISEESGTFDIEEYGEDDEYSDMFRIKIPYDAEPGKYTFNAEIIFEDGEYTQNFEVQIDEALRTESITLSPINLDESKKKPEVKDSISKKSVRDPWEVAIVILVMLAIGIVLELVLIGLIKKQRKQPVKKE